MTFLPIVERELRIASRNGATYWLRFFAALAAAVVALLAMWGNGSRSSPVMIAKEMFTILSCVIMVFCLFAGMFQTADCLSSEKREGTLGLLFLTDLHGYDVVLGKLVATSLNVCYGLISAFPILAIPLLVGGISVNEFWRAVIVLLVGLFFSLGVGMFVSAVTRESRQALGTTAFAIILIAALLPAIQGVVNAIWNTNHHVRVLLWPSLGYALSRSFDVYYQFRNGPREFWGSVLTIVGIGFGCLLLASVVLPRAWQEKSQAAGPAKGGSRWRRLRFGTEKRRSSLRELMSANPFHWLTVRDRMSQMGFWMVVAILLPLWLVLMVSTQMIRGGGFARFAPLQFLIFITFALSLSFKIFMAMESSRRLNDDRQSGALELLLVTPLSVDKIISGQRRALRNQFGLPLLLIEILLVVVRALSSRMQMGGNHFIEIMLGGNMVVLFADFLALSWVGMWAGLRSRQHHRAVLIILLKIMVVPWLLYFLIGVAGFFRMGRGPEPFFVIWFSSCVANDLFWGLLARRGLRDNFRRLAAGGSVGDAVPAITATFNPTIA